jgi:hypothetical protein
MTSCEECGIHWFRKRVLTKPHIKIPVKAEKIRATSL